MNSDFSRKRTQRSQKMSSLSFSILAALLVAVASTTDPIDKVVADLSANPLWENGLSASLDLPKTATTEQVVAKVFQMTGFSGKGTSYKILKTRKVHIKGSLPDLYTAVLLKTGPNEEVVLLQYNGDWWSRILPVP
jgi:hypothetical protein